MVRTAAVCEPLAYANHSRSRGFSPLLSEPEGTAAVSDAVNLGNPDLYINRELSLLEFNRRVLAQATDVGIPLLERLRFLCIASSNLDEFFEIRVAGLKQQLEFGVSIAGRTTWHLRNSFGASPCSHTTSWPSSTAC